METELSDWIQDVCWLNDGTSLAIATAHNVIVCWNLQKQTVIETVHCEEKCILYSARFINTSWDRLILAAGTVFNEIVLWSPTHGTGSTAEQPRKVLHRLTGHQGVIFSIAYSAVCGLLASVSDDRSVRVWRVTGLTETTPSCPTGWSAAVFTPLHVLYGHSARVWSLRLLSQHGDIVTVGEDATCIVWDATDGRIRTKFTGHMGKSIWSLGVNEDETLLVTGGGDSSIRLWTLPEKTQGKSLSNQTVTQTLCLPQQTEDSKSTSGELAVPENTEDFPRIVKLLDSTSVLVMTNQGRLLLYCTKSRTWRLLYQNDRYASYSVLAVHAGKVLIGNIHGKVALVNTSSGETHEHQVYSGKVHSICWLDEELFLTTGPDGSMIVCEIIDSGMSLTQRHHFLLPATKQRWVSAAAVLRQHAVLVAGDRGGTVHTYTMAPGDQQPLSPIQSFARIHGKAGVTGLCHRGDRLYTAGRDGMYRVWQIQADGRISLLQANRVLRGCDWLADIQFVGDALWVLVFHTDRFLAVNVTNGGERAFSVACGGGHRSWSFLPPPPGGHSGGTATTFVYIKAGGVVLCGSKDGGTRGGAGQTILKPSLHGRELCDVKHLYSTQNTGPDGCCHLLVTAGEDTLINVVAVHDSPDIPHRVMTTVQGHISSVRALALSKANHKTTPFFDQQTLQSSNKHMPPSNESTQDNLQPIAGSSINTASSIPTLSSNQQVLESGGKHVLHFNELTGDIELPKAGSSINRAGESVTAVLFSAGGRAQIKAWRIHVQENRVTGDEEQRTVGQVTGGEPNDVGCEMEGDTENIRIRNSESASVVNDSDVKVCDSHVIGIDSNTLCNENKEGDSDVVGVCDSQGSCVRDTMEISEDDDRQCDIQNTVGMQNDSNSAACAPMTATDASSAGCGGLRCWSECLGFHSLGQGRRRGGNKPWRHKVYNPSPETRYMRLASFPVSDLVPSLHDGLHIVAAACSDGFLRIFGFDEESKQFTLLAHTEYHDHCVLCVQHLIHTNHSPCYNQPANHSHRYIDSSKQVLIFTSATDGKVSCWDITHLTVAFSELHRMEPDSGAGSDSHTERNCVDICGYCEKLDNLWEEDGVLDLGHPGFDLVAHQNGINALDLRQMQDGSLLLATGSDDNGLAVCELNQPSQLLTQPAQDRGEHPQVSKYHALGGGDHTPGSGEIEKDRCLFEVGRMVFKADAHATQITGVKILKNQQIISSSIDQRLSLWNIDTELKEMKLESCEFFDVADASALETWKLQSDGSSAAAVVCGVGLQTFHVTNTTH